MELPCPTCLEKKAKEEKPTLNLIAYYKTIKSGMVDPIIMKFRSSLCKACMEVEVDEGGHKRPIRLFRRLPKESKDSIPYCGQPDTFIGKLFGKRKQLNYGCGCNLDEKVKWRASKCPRNKWGPDEYLGPGMLIERISHKTTWLEDTIDLHVQCRTNKRDCNGIGDIVCATHVAAGLKAKTGKRVRLVVIPRNVTWASLVWPIEDIEVEGSMTRARDQRWCVPRSWIQADMSAIVNKLCRVEQWSMNVGANGDFGKVNINLKDESLLWAQEELRGPLEENRPVVIIGPYAYSMQRTWPMTRWIALIEALKELGFDVRVLDGPQGKERTGYMPCMRYWGQPPDNVMAMLRYSTAFIGNDSGLAHLASALKKHTFVICAPTVGDLAFKHYDQRYVHIIQAEGECTGCLFQKDRGFKLQCAPECELTWNVKVRHVIDLIKEHIPIKEGVDDGRSIRFCDVGGERTSGGNDRAANTSLVAGSFGKYQSGGVRAASPDVDVADIARQEETELERGGEPSPGRAEDWPTAYVRDHDISAEGGLHGPQANPRGAQTRYAKDPGES